LAKVWSVKAKAKAEQNQTANQIKMYLISGRKVADDMLEILDGKGCVEEFGAPSSELTG
jgi:hypothetical protein